MDWWLEADKTHMVLKLRICGTLPQLLHMPSWHGALLSTETSLPFPSHAVYANLDQLDTRYLYF